MFVIMAVKGRSVQMDAMKHCSELVDIFIETHTTAGAFTMPMER